MNITVKKLPESRVEMEITLPWEEWKGEIDHAAEGLSKDVKVSGFRPGKVPRDVIEKRFGKQALLVEAAEHVVGHSYEKALGQEKIDAIGQPEVKLGKMKEGEDFEYSVITTVMPEVTLKKNWKDKVKDVNKKQEKKEVAVSEEEVTKELEHLASSRAKLVTVKREAKMGDNVLLDFVVKQDGVVIEGGKSEKHPLILGAGVFIPGFEEQVVGMKENDEKTFTLTFPSEYHAKHLAGKEAAFEVKMQVVQEREIPELNDAFAKSLGNFDSLEKVKENIRTGMGEEKKTKKKEEHRIEILDVLVENAELEYPKLLVEQELSRMIREFETQLQSVGMNLSAYLEQTKKTDEELRNE